MMSLHHEIVNATSIKFTARRNGGSLAFLYPTVTADNTLLVEIFILNK